MANFSLQPFRPILNRDFQFTAEINQNIHSIFISFLITGELKSINFDPPTPAKERVIKLWEKTCFELFLKNNRDEYLEFNFSPRFEWNCFYFKQKGDQLSEWEKMQQPKIDILLSLNKFFLVAEVKKEFFPVNFQTDNMTAGISSVLKNYDDQLTYWALSHEDSKPNFHNFDSFKYKF